MSDQNRKSVENLIYQALCGGDIDGFTDKANDLSVKIIEFTQKESGGNYFIGMLAVQQVAVVMAENLGLTKDQTMSLIGGLFDGD